MDKLWLLTLVVLVIFAILIAFYLIKTIWQFSVKLKIKYPMLGLIWQAFWLSLLLFILLLILLTVKDEYLGYERKKEREALISTCDTVERVSGDIVKLEYDRLKKQGFSGYEAIETISEQNNSMGKYIKCMIVTDKMSIRQIDDYFAVYTSE